MCSVYIYMYNVHVYSRSQKKSTFCLRTVFITVCVFITVARALCVLHFRCFFYSVSGGSGREYAASGSHHVRGPGLSSCA